MLWALALLGLLPTAFLFGGPEEDAESAETDGPAPDAADESGAEPPVDLLETLGEDPADEVGSDYSVQLGTGESVFTDFRAGEDHITLSLGDGGGEFLVEPMVDSDGNEVGTSLSYLTDGDEMTVSFLGYEDVPAEDISVLITDPDTGIEELYSLTEMGDFGALAPNDPDAPAEAGPSGDGESLTSNDPDAPSEAGPAGDPDNPALSTNDDPDAASGQVVEHVLGDGGETLVLPDDPFEGGTDAQVVDGEMQTDGTLHVVTGGAGDDLIATGDEAAIVDGGAGNDTIYGGEGSAILSGGDGDDTLYAGNDTSSDYVLSGDAGADTLIGGDGVDTILMDAEDTASGGAGADSFWLYFDAGANVGFAAINDFTVGEDMLRVTIDGGPDYAGNLDLEVRQTDDGASSEVVVDGQVVAVLYGAPNVVAGDIMVELSASSA